MRDRGPDEPSGRRSSDATDSRHRTPFFSQPAERDDEGDPISEDALHLSARCEAWEAVGITELTPSILRHACIMTSLWATANGSWAV
jgi:hypothetical protein